MGTLLLFIGGFVGASSAAKKTFLQSWVFLVNLCFSAYLGIFLAPLVIPMLEIPGLDPGYKNAIAVFGLMFVAMVVLYKAVESIFPNREVSLALPALAERIGSLTAGFFAGMVVVTLAIYCYCQCPFSSLVTSPSRESLKEVAGNSMLRMIRTVNIFSLQFISTEGERDLQSLGVLPPPPPAKPRPPRKTAPANRKAPAVPESGGTQTNSPVTAAPPDSRGNKETTDGKASPSPVPAVPENPPPENKTVRPAN